MSTDRKKYYKEGKGRGEKERNLMGQKGYQRGVYLNLKNIKFSCGKIKEARSRNQPVTILVKEADARKKVGVVQRREEGIYIYIYMHHHQKINPKSKERKMVL